MASICGDNLMESQDLEGLLSKFIYGIITIPGRILTMDEVYKFGFVLNLYGFFPRITYAYPTEDPLLGALLVGIEPKDLSRMWTACETHGFSFIPINQVQDDASTNDSGD